MEVGVRTKASGLSQYTNNNLCIERHKLHFLAVTVESNIQINFYLVHSFGCGGGCENSVVRNSVIVVRWKQKQ
jgi:hypothetical protein